MSRFKLTPEQMEEAMKASAAIGQPSLGVNLPEHHSVSGRTADHSSPPSKTSSSSKSVQKKSKPVDVTMVEIKQAAEAAGYGRGVEEHAFEDGRMWRFDLCWPDYKVAFEREGGIWVTVHCKKCGESYRTLKSRHTSEDGYRNDCEKYSIANIRGWCVIRGTPEMLSSGAALVLVLAALKERSKS